MPDEASPPIVVFIHVPKTAGSTVNGHLAEWGAGIDHCETLIDDRPRLADALDHVRWVSGHVPRPAMVERLRAATDRPLRLYSLVRHPAEQVRSHYNWLIEIRRRSTEFYEGHPPAVKAISEQLRGSNNEDPDTVIANLRRYAGLFLNVQSRFVLGPPPAGRPDDDDHMASELNRYALVGADTVGPVVGAMTGRTVDESTRFNSSPYHVSAEVFRSPALIEFLDHHNQRDIRLHRQVARISTDP